MLSHLDRIIFPDRCEVIEVIPSQRYVYTIFKNGHSSFVSAKRKNKWPVRINQQIQKLKQIDTNCKIISKSGIEVEKNENVNYSLKKPFSKEKLLSILNELWQK